MRRLLSLSVVASWLAMMALLVHRQASPPMTRMEALPAGTVAERDEWFDVQREGRKIGHAHRVTTARPGGGHVFYEDSVMALAMLGSPQTLRTSLMAETEADFALRRFRFTLVTPATVFSAAGTSDGRRLTVTYGAEGQQQELALPITEPIYLPSTLRPRVLAGDLTPGTAYTVPVFNPLTMKNEPLTVTVEAHEPIGGTEGIRLAEEHHGVRARVWLARDGGVLREEGSLGFTLERVGRAQALAVDPTTIPVDLVATSRIPLEGRIADARNTDRLTLRVRGAAVAKIPDDPPRQRLRADLLSITREPAPAPVPLPLPRTNALADYLGPGLFIESDDAAIVAAARTAVGGETDATRAARRLVTWVHGHVEQAPSVTVPSAREVLASRRGDCNEHAVLLAALARAAGIPARVVAGAMYLDDGFYYHAWTELWLERWVSADAVFDQLPVDATHVKIIEGGPERHLALAEVIGKLAFKTEENP
jgi:hypothetical protein